MMTKICVGCVSYSLGGPEALTPGDRCSCCGETKGTNDGEPKTGMVFSSLVGWHKRDDRLHFATTRENVTTIVCGAGLGLVFTGRFDGTGDTAPTQHTPWTTDRKAWDAASNACEACKAALTA